MEAAGFRDLHYMPVLGPVHRPRLGTAHRERAMAKPAMVMLEAVGEEPPQVPLVEDDDLVQALAASAPDHPFGERVLPGTARCGEYLSATWLRGRAGLFW
jgi:hypothetical protein